MTKTFFIFKFPWSKRAQWSYNKEFVNVFRIIIWQAMKIRICPIYYTSFSSPWNRKITCILRKRHMIRRKELQRIQRPCWEMTSNRICKFLKLNFIAFIISNTKSLLRKFIKFPFFFIKVKQNFFRTFRFFLCKPVFAQH